METLTVTERAVDHVRQLITTLQLKPGLRINENEWATNLGISRPPLREALRVLETEQLIVTYPRRGSYVADLSLSGLKECCRARMMIECEVIDFLSEKNIRDLPEVEKSFSLASSMALPSDENPQAMVAYLKSWVEYHVKLVQASRNSWLIRFYSAISSTLIRYQFICLYQPGQSAKSRREHEQILSLIKNGKYERAKKVLVSHMRSLVEILEDRLAAKLPIRD